MHFYLTELVGAGTEEDPYRPPVDTGPWAVIDFRPDLRVREGRALLVTSDPVSTRRRGLVSLGDDPDARSVANRSRLQSELKVDLAQNNLRANIAELLILHGTAPHDRSRWNRLPADVRGRHRIEVLGEVLYDAPAPVAYAEHNFVPSLSQVGKTLEETGEWDDVVPGFVIIDDGAQAAIRSTVGANYSRLIATTDTDNMYVSAFVSIGNGVNQASVCARCEDGSELTFHLGRWNQSSTRWQIYTFVEGAASLKTESGLDPQSTNYPTTLETDGGVLRLRGLSEVVKASTTDVSLVGRRRGGIRSGHNAANPTTFWDVTVRDLHLVESVSATLGIEIDLGGTLDVPTATVPELAGSLDLEVDLGGTLSQPEASVADVAATLGVEIDLGGTLDVPAASVPQMVGSLDLEVDLGGELSRPTALVPATSGELALIFDLGGRVRHPLPPVEFFEGTGRATVAIDSGRAETRVTSGRSKARTP